MFKAVLLVLIKAKKMEITQIPTNKVPGNPVKGLETAYLPLQFPGGSIYHPTRPCGLSPPDSKLYNDVHGGELIM